MRNLTKTDITICGCPVWLESDNKNQVDLAVTILGNNFRYKVSDDLPLFKEPKEHDLDLPAGNEPLAVPNGKQPEPEWITTETDAGFVAVVRAIANNKCIYLKQDDSWSICQSPEHWDLDLIISNLFRDGLVYGIQNPSYTEPKKPEVGEVWKFNKSGLGVSEAAVYHLYKDGIHCHILYRTERGEFSGLQYARVDWLTEFTGRTINLDELEGEK